MSSRTLFSSLAALLLAVSTTRSAAASEADAVDEEVESFERHRLSLGAAVRPYPVVTSMGGDGRLNDPQLGELVGMGIDAGYGLRLDRYLEIGIGTSYALYYDTDAGKGHAHELTIPAHVGLVIPAGKRAEVRIAGHVGWLNYWFPRAPTEYVFKGAIALHAMGVSAGPELTGYFAVSDRLDVFVQTRAAWGWASATNGVSYLDGLPIMSIVVGSGLGMRVRL